MEFPLKFAELKVLIVEEGSFLPVKLMGGLLSSYRNYCSKSPAKKAHPPNHQKMMLEANS